VIGDKLYCSLEKGAARTVGTKVLRTIREYLDREEIEAKSSGMYHWYEHLGSRRPLEKSTLRLFFPDRHFRAVMRCEADLSFALVTRVGMSCACLLFEHATWSSKLCT
jgi:hypothetical protein